MKLFSNSPDALFTREFTLLIVFIAGVLLGFGLRDLLAIDGRKSMWTQANMCQSNPTQKGCEKYR
jgi:hypothetical protein